MIILDFEVNTNNIGDVLEVAAVKIDKDFNILDKFHRYYISRYPLNFYSYQIHRLTPELILDYRKDKTYSSYFSEDKDFENFCKNSETLIAHNIKFELRHINKRVQFKKYFCTMEKNKNLIKVFAKDGRVKNPNLEEVCNYYGIDFDSSKYHSATYDVTKTYEILKKMKIF